MSRRTVAAAIAATVTALVSVFAVDVPAQTGDVRVVASNGVKSVLDEILPQGEKVIGHRVAIQFGTSASLKQKIDAGEPFDVAIMTSEAIDDLVKSGHVVAGSRTAIGRSGIGVGARSGVAKPDITSPAALKQTLLRAKSFTYAEDGASRPHIVRMLNSMGIVDQVKSKTILEQGSVRAAARVTGGDAELLITLISEILPVQGMQLVGPLPAEFQNYVSFAAGTGAKARNAAAGKALIEFLSAPSAKPMFKAKGIEPSA